MEFNLPKEYIRMILEENFDNAYEDNVLRGETITDKQVFISNLKIEIENCPWSFDCFFETCCDELATSDLEERKALISSIFE